MTCKEATAKLDLGVKHLSLVARLQLEAHLLICLACRRYLTASRAVQDAVRAMVGSKPVDFERLGRELLKRFGS